MFVSKFTEHSLHEIAKKLRVVKSPIQKGLRSVCFKKNGNS